MSDFGEKLRKVRKEKKLTQRQLADLIDAKHNSVSNWETGINRPDPDTIGLICGVLQVSPNDLLSSQVPASPHAGDPEPDFLPLSPDVSQLIHLYRSVNPDGQSRILDYAQIISSNKEMQKDHSAAM